MYVCMYVFMYVCIYIYMNGGELSIFAMDAPVCMRIRQSSLLVHTHYVHECLTSAPAQLLSTRVYLYCALIHTCAHAHRFTHMHLRGLWDSFSQCWVTRVFCLSSNVYACSCCECGAVSLARLVHKWLYVTTARMMTLAGRMQ